jgi:hypothetical protein
MLSSILKGQVRFDEIETLNTNFQSSGIGLSLKAVFRYSNPLKLNS